jgi:hypothetical protein
VSDSASFVTNQAGRAVDRVIASMVPFAEERRDCSSRSAHRPRLDPPPAYDPSVRRFVLQTQPSIALTDTAARGVRIS